LLAPWVLTTCAAALVWPSALTMVGAAVYPIAVIAGAVHVSATRSVNPFAAAAAIGIVHMAWSLGFWRGALRR
jgi:hypothetical protein